MKLKEFLQRLADDPKLFREFEREPEVMLRKMRLSPQAQKDLRSENPQRIVKRIEVEEGLSRKQWVASEFISIVMLAMRPAPLEAKPGRKRTAAGPKTKASRKQARVRAKTKTSRKPVKSKAKAKVRAKRQR